jgi:hypothetical protein
MRLSFERKELGFLLCWMFKTKFYLKHYLFITFAVNYEAVNMVIKPVCSFKTIIS